MNPQHRAWRQAIESAWERRAEPASGEIEEIRLLVDAVLGDIERAGDKVKVTVQFRGRQMAHTDIGFTVLAEFTTKVEDVAVVEKRPLLEGRNMSMIIVPKVVK